MSYDVIGLGYSATDYLGIVPKYPVIDTKVELEEFSIQGGGVTATAIVAVSRLGAKAGFIGVVGDDSFGAFAIDELKREGIDTSGVVIRPGASSQFAFIVIDKPTGKRNIFWSRSGLDPLRAEEVCREQILSGKILHVDNHEPEAATQAAKWANEAGIPVLADAGSWKPGTDELIEHIDVLIASHRFAEEFTGESDPMTAARKMLTGRRQVSMVTCGDQGSFCVTREEEFHTPAFKVDVVDTTGAGDVFHGAFSFSLARGWDVRKAALFSSAVAAIKCTALGGRKGIPTLEKTHLFLSERGHRLL